MADETNGTKGIPASESPRRNAQRRRMKATPRTRGVQIGATPEETGAFAAIVSPDATEDEIEAFFAQAESANKAAEARRAAAREERARAQAMAQGTASASGSAALGKKKPSADQRLDEAVARLEDPSITLVHGGVSVRGLPANAEKRAAREQGQGTAPQQQGRVPRTNDAFVASVAASGSGAAASANASNRPVSPAPTPSANASWRTGLPSLADEPAAGKPAGSAPAADDQLKPLFPSPGDSAQVDPFAAMSDLPPIDTAAPEETPMYGQFGRVEQGFVSADPMYRERHRGRTILRNVAIAFIVLVLAGFGAWYLWNHRGVEIIVNGVRMSAGSSATVGELYDAERWPVNPGDLVSVAGTLLQEGAGESYAAVVNGEVLTPKESTTRMLHGGETIVFRDGEDILEEYDVTVLEEAPKLVMAGDEQGTVSFVSQWGKAGRTERRRGRTSGETIDEKVSDPQDMVVTTLTPTPANDEKLVALTFDDGPSYYTTQLLNSLSAKNAHATFFSIGQYVDISPDVAAAIVAGGNQLCGHTMTHLTLTEQPSETVYAEVSDGQAALEKATGVKTTTFRPPNGGFRATTWTETGGAVSASILWDIDTLDINKPTADQIIARVNRDIHPGAIVLMYDGGGDRTMDTIALPVLIDQLQEQGYRLVTISELLASDPRIPAEIANGDATMPEDAAWPTEVA